MTRCPHNYETEQTAAKEQLERDRAELDKHKSEEERNEPFFAIEQIACFSWEDLTVPMVLQLKTGWEKVLDCHLE